MRGSVIFTDMYESKTKSLVFSDFEGVLGTPKVKIEQLNRVGSPKPNVSFVIPVHNQEKIIIKNLDALTKSAATEHELVLVLDSCIDGSEEIVYDWSKMHMLKQNLTSTITICVPDMELFETRCDVVGVHLSRGSFVIEVQADMEIDDPGFDKRLLGILEENQDIFALSGRGCHKFQEILGNAEKQNLLEQIINSLTGPFSRLFKVKQNENNWDTDGTAGRLGRSIDLAINSDEYGKVFLSETVMRGPLAFSKEKYEKLGGFDYQNFFLGNDDHDLVYRAWKVQNWRSGYTPVDFKSPVEDGSTRAKKTKKQLDRFAKISGYYNDRKVHSYLFNPEYEESNFPAREIRTISELPQ